MRLIFVTQRVDPGDPVLGATVAKIAALAARVDEVVVLADSVVSDSLPVNCSVHSFAAGSRVGRGLRFERALGRELARRPRPAAVIAHMCPIYAVLAAPLARPVGTRVAALVRALESDADAGGGSPRLEHRHLGRSLIGSRRVREGRWDRPRHRRVGLRLHPAPPGGTVLLTVLGRYSAAKGLDTMLRAVALARADGVDARLRAHGTTAHPASRRI